MIALSSLSAVSQKINIPIKDQHMHGYDISYNTGIHSMDSIQTMNPVDSILCSILGILSISIAY